MRTRAGTSRTCSSFAAAFLVLAATGCAGSNGGDDAPATGGMSATGGSSGSGGAGGTGGAMPPPGLAGVVVVENDQAACVPLCTLTTESDGDDWSLENGVSCVIPNTSTGHNQRCTTGEALPEPVSVPGVVVTDGSAGTTECYPLCVYNTDPALDPEMDDWSWENNRSCVIPDTLTGKNQACMTLEPLPEPEPRPGILVNPESGTEPECVPVCMIATEPTAENSDWSYENNESCVLPETVTAMGRRECTFGVTPDYTPPALGGEKVAEGFYTADGRLYDAYGNDFVIRGVNNAHAWFDGYAEYKAWQALDNIQSYGANTIRVVWETAAAPTLLEDVLYRIVELEMVPMVELHDATGVRDAARLITTAEYWTRADVLPVLQAFRPYLLINIANEWSGGEEYLATYQTVVANLRAAGLEHTLVIDASGFGQNAQSLFDSAATLTAADPESNLLFSIHMYDLFEDPARVDTVLNQAVTMQIPLIVGEFGPMLNGKAVAWQAIMETSEALDLGYLAWSWMGNNVETEHLDMAEDWEGPLTTWGNDVLNGENGIASTATKASIFE